MESRLEAFQFGKKAVSIFSVCMCVSVYVYVCVCMRACVCESIHARGRKFYPIDTKFGTQICLLKSKVQF